jgi:hypothetical protein
MTFRIEDRAEHDRRPLPPELVGLAPLAEVQLHPNDPDQALKKHLAPRLRLGRCLGRDGGADQMSRSQHVVKDQQLDERE